MKLLTWAAVIGVAYTAGYFSDFSKREEIAQSTDDCPPLAQVADKGTALSPPPLESPPVVTNPSSSSKAKQNHALANSSANDEFKEQQMQQPQAAPPTEHPMDPTSPAESNVSDEEIDNLLPTPFNEILKRTRGPIREKYKEFADAEEPSEWDRQTENRITDMLLGHAQSKFLEVDSVRCRRDLCEIRGRQLKANVFGLIMSEMTIQDWWTMGNTQWTSGETGVLYALLMKNPSPKQSPQP